MQITSQTNNTNLSFQKYVDMVDDKITKLF